MRCATTPRHGKVASTAADVVEQMAPAIKKSRVAKILDFGKKVASAPVAAVQAVRARAAH